ncbi:MAG: CHAT domain-containing protein [Bacteroidota bacterium]|nr:CHAT domain-containing protein [Bacteroidota bacterium]MDP4257268.1 CHAT domain-containing protein [Bacteroidota bacterium]
MLGKNTVFFLAFQLIVSFIFANQGPPPDRIARTYHRADSLFHLSNTTPATDSASLAGFEEVIRALGNNAPTGYDASLLFQSYLKKGILLDSKANFAGARDAYLMALHAHKEIDSAAFVAYIYAGACYYNLNDFDSANYFLLRAEPLISRFKDPEDEIRLYNTLGVLYYDNGNYRQGKNYFSRALEIVKSRQPFDTLSAASIEINMGTSLYRLGSYEESLSQFHSTLRYRVFGDYVFMNMGRAYTALGRYAEALSSFRKVNSAKMPSVFNEMANTEWQLKRVDSCKYYLDRLQPYKIARKLNALDIGINELYRAQWLNGQGQYQAALSGLQQAIMIFSGNFSNPDILTNPSGFTGTFTYFHLFDALLEKARVFGRLYRSQPEEAWLSGGFDAYKAALAILRYIEKSYDTDDAKLFLKKKSGGIYKEALDVCLALWKRHPDKNYLEQAFSIGERNRASIIAAGMMERNFAGAPGSNEEALLKRERNIKYNIARLNVNIDETRDSRRLEQMTREVASYEIDLARLQKQLEHSDAWYREKYEDASPGISEIQQRLNGRQALISFNSTVDALHVFVITASSFQYARIDSLAALQHDIGSWLNELRTTGNGKRFRGEEIGSRLYERLVRPIRKMAGDKPEWIIIPHGILYELPFESLPSGDAGEPLLVKTTISYQFSARLLLSSSQDDKNALGPSAYKILAFAPFAGGNGRPLSGFNPLPASADEIASLPGAQFLDSAATKVRFLKEMNNYPIIHLATHAVSSFDNAAESFVAFYPQKGVRVEDCLFLEELYGLNMSKTRLVVISACETGQGELVSNEGVISLARAFTYAGCESTVSSLWKANDKATSFILKRFHVYLQEGYDKAKALQQAKLDYIASDAVEKSPAYWSHLILIGDTAPLVRAGHSQVYYWVACLAAAAVLFILAARRRKKKKSRRLSQKEDLN